MVPTEARIGLVPGTRCRSGTRSTCPPGLAVALGVIHQSSSFTSFTNAVKLPGFTRVDAAAYYTFLNGKMRLALNVENLGNTKYYPTADGDNNISPGAPINARLTLSGTF
jgi:catecholate siderophore receptor